MSAPSPAASVRSSPRLRGVVPAAAAQTTKARAAVRQGTAFVRARVSQLPPPSALGADAYVLWARSPDGRSTYLGALPRNNFRL
ncbi:MAG: hypothetical protein LC729_01280 [Acidobacteria bacterium]|nr:hypothetical protein [Acidobacteriota bacterium]